MTSFDKTGLPTLEALLSVRETCAYFGTSRPTLYRVYIAELGLPVVKIKGRTMFEPQALREFVARYRNCRLNDDDLAGSKVAVQASPGVEPPSHDPD
ncbi:MAG: helix-turn-helix domain-containing protein [Actinobacteria bacterium]|nr:helix-turn-helix domain-containing protein [Actinomycetota bacterium]